MLNFGFSVPSFIFFMSLVIIAAVLTSRRGAFCVLAVGLVTMGVFAADNTFRNFYSLQAAR